MTGGVGARCGIHVLAQGGVALMGDRGGGRPVLSRWLLLCAPRAPRKPDIDYIVQLILLGF